MHNNLAKSVTISPNGNKYEVKFPNTGEYMEIMSLKSRLTGDLNTGDNYSFYAYLMAEMIATYTIMIPELKKDLNVTTISQLSMIESKELLDSYTEVYKPFFEGWMAVITKPKEVKDGK